MELSNRKHLDKLDQQMAATGLAIVDQGKALHARIDAELRCVHDGLGSTKRIVRAEMQCSNDFYKLVLVFLTAMTTLDRAAQVDNARWFARWRKPSPAYLKAHTAYWEAVDGLRHFLATLGLDGPVEGRVLYTPAGGVLQALGHMAATGLTGVARG